MKIKCVKGTRDYLPREAELRESMQRTISEIYRENGFSRITTPAIEDAENLDKSDGGDNLNLIFKILKRGDKLRRALADGDENGLCDLGLRYDLTLPLTRYFAANRQSLPMPFKAIQMDKVYRAENPQKGRLREFMQCDIDVIGDGEPECEIELIAVTAKALLALDIGKFTVRVNDREVLNGMLAALGFPEGELATVCVSFDKLDKIGAEGVAAELAEKGFDKTAVDGLSDVLSQLPLTLDRVTEIVGAEKTARLSKIIADSKAMANGEYGVEFDISLVRGQGYYTGTVFEVRSENYGSSVAGGGRYDKLIGKFIGEEIPACGFSIGFERIFGILAEQNRTASSKKMLAALYEDNFTEVCARADELRKEYDVAIYKTPKKLGAFLNRLQACGFVGFAYPDGNVKMFDEK
ncbi:MAG: histidine--tRNA ligase [Lachnospiraceae bacterium]|nr:histidine--tRNA ligase [Ruminococcus sp.]MCM1274588.1 histidine--tRNA ligase [Lachnospiraceae bacterium]